MCKGNQLVKNNFCSYCAKEIIHFNANFIVLMCNWSDIVYYIGYNGLNMEEKAAT